MTTALADTVGPGTTAGITTAGMTTAGPSSAGRTRVPAGKTRRPRLVSVPDAEPPFDDELSATTRVRRLRAHTAAAAAAHTPVAPVASSAVVTGRDRPAGPGLAPGRSISPAAGISPAGGISPAAGDSPAGTWAAADAHSPGRKVGVGASPIAPLPQARRTAVLLARALVEVVTGVRPLRQLRDHCSPAVFTDLLGRQAQRGAADIRTELAKLQSTHIRHPRDGVAEVAAVFRRGTRVRAMAFQLTGQDGRWQITALQIG